MIPLLVGIGGGGSSSGKTALGCDILKRLSASGKKWGAIKYTRTGLYSSIVQDPEILGQAGKDTARFLSAGAGEVRWVQSPKESLSETLSTALGMLSRMDGVLVEGNSAIEVLRPDIVIFIFDSRGGIKPGAERILEMADIIIAGEGETRFSEKVFALDDGLERVMALIAKTEIEKELKAKAAEGKITCAIAREIAGRLGIEPKEVGRAADSLGIKITDCQMGCF